MMASWTPDAEIRMFGTSVLRIAAFASRVRASIVAYGAFVGTAIRSCRAHELLSIWAVRLPLAALLVRHYGWQGVVDRYDIELCSRVRFPLSAVARTLAESAMNRNNSPSACRFEINRYLCNMNAKKLLNRWIVAVGARGSLFFLVRRMGTVFVLFINPYKFVPGGRLRHGYRHAQPLSSFRSERSVYIVHIP